MNQDILIRNNVHVLGNTGQPIMFAHGFGCEQRIWRLVAPAFADTHQLVLFDYVGSGKSDKRAFSVDRYTTLAGYAQDVLDVCAALDLTNLIFVGHSISGMVGALAARRAPERFERLIMIGSSASYINEPPDYVGGFERAEIEGLLDLMEKNYQGWASFLAPLAMKNADRPDLAHDLEETFLAMDPAIARYFAQATFLSDNRADLPFVTVPSLILQCAEDLIVPREAALYLRDHLPASTLQIMQVSGHYPHVSHAEQTIQLIQEYLAQAKPAELHHRD
jgi:sigma-B regulation protein RsbQ